MTELFTSKNIYSLRKQKLLKLPSLMGTESWLFRSVLVWNNLPNRVKEVKSLSMFKNLLLKQKLYCKCKICR